MGGLPGAVIATLGEVTPSIIVILLIAVLLKNFQDNQYVNWAFYGLRPASTGLIGGACVAVMLEVLTFVHISAGGIVNTFGLERGQIFNLPALALAAVLLVLTNWVKKVKEWHPIVFIGLSAVVGVNLPFWRGVTIGEGALPLKKHVYRGLGIDAAKKPHIPP